VLHIEIHAVFLTKEDAIGSARAVLKQWKREAPGARISESVPWEGVTFAGWFAADGGKPEMFVLVNRQ
jgi:hypothetical protein